MSSFRSTTMRSPRVNLKRARRPARERTANADGERKGRVKSEKKKARGQRKRKTDATGPRLRGPDADVAQKVEKEGDGCPGRLVDRGGGEGAGYAMRR